MHSNKIDNFEKVESCSKNDSTSNIDLNQFSYDVHIPMVMFLDKTLDANAIKLYAFVRGLTKAHGYCYATNDYLANLMGCKKRAIQNWLKSLKKSGYIEIQKDENKFRPDRKIFMAGSLKKSLHNAQSCTPPCTAMHPPVHNGAPIYTSIKRTLIEKKKGSMKEKKPPLSAKEKIQKNHKQEYEKLCQQFGQEEVDSRLERIFPAVSNPLELLKKFLDQDKEQIEASPKYRLARNYALLEEAKKAIGSREFEIGLLIGPDYFESRAPYQHIKVDDKRFFECLTEHLTNRKII